MSDELVRRAEEIVKEGEAVALSLDLEDPDRADQIVLILADVGTRLAGECLFIEGVNPETCLGRLREAFRFVETSHIAPPKLEDRLIRINNAAKAARLRMVKVHEPRHMAGERPLEMGMPEIVKLVDLRRPDEDTFHFEIFAAEDADILKWIGRALPRIECKGATVMVDGPPAFHKLVERKLQE